MRWPTTQALISYTLLWINLGFSLLGSTLANIAVRYANERPHNFIRLVNEALSRLYLSYFGFFIVLVLVLLNQNAEPLVILADLLIAIFVLVMWGFSLYATTVFSDMDYVEKVHGCKITGYRCDRPASTRDFVKVCALNLIGAGVTFLIVTAIILFSPLLNSAPK